ncbi:MAG TPA: alpha/beta hydrolase [Nevskia sp.]|nr:alpha/beta hydrolase [Nevskia sp.]
MNPPDAADGARAGPSWFRQAIACEAVSFFLPFEGVQLHYRCWNADEAGKPALLFLHGYRGHCRWWDFIAPFFTERFRVAALDFSGMGDSGWRPAYALRQHSAEIGAVIRHAGLAPATVVGHSYGGSRLLRACADGVAGIGHAIVLDSFVNFPDRDPVRSQEPLGRRTPYPDLATALSRFRLIPPQAAEPWLFDYVARHSLKAAEGGWQWKFDPALPFGAPELDGPELLQRITVPVSYICGERSAVVDAARARRIAGQLARGRGPVILPQAGHHLMLDQPLALVAALRALLA